MNDINIDSNNEIDNYNNNSLNKYNNDNNLLSSPDTFWSEDINALYKNDKYLEFIPNNSMTRIEQLNAMSRFFIYMGIIFIIFGLQVDYLLLPIIGLSLLFIIYKIIKIDSNEKIYDEQRLKKINKIIKIDTSVSPLNNTEDLNDSDITNNVTTKANVINTTCNITTNGNNISNDSLNNNIACYPFDMNGANVNDDGNDINYDVNNTIYLKIPNDKIRDKYTLDEMRSYKQNKCRRPTIENPFMNTSINDFGTDNISFPCDPLNEEIKKEMIDNFNKKIFAGIDKLFDNEFAQRQFFTMPYNIPNDQDGFARWCYDFPKTCKEYQRNCNNYVNYRLD